MKRVRGYCNRHLKQGPTKGDVETSKVCVGCLDLSINFKCIECTVCHGKFAAQPFLSMIGCSI